MPRTPETLSFTHAAYTAIQEIPPGRVTSYGHIARLIGTPQRPRQIGILLKHLPTTPSSRFNTSTVPWQRVINAKGGISPRAHPSGAPNQAAALRAEGVVVSTGALGELSVDLGVYGWFPRRLPSEEVEGVEMDDSDEEM